MKFLGPDFARGVNSLQIPYLAKQPFSLSKGGIPAVPAAPEKAGKIAQLDQGRLRKNFAGIGKIGDMTWRENRS